MNRSLPLHYESSLYRCWRSIFVFGLILFFANTTRATCNLTATWTYYVHGDTVYFYAADTNTTAHHFWNFGDGHTASGISATHIYPNYGTYHACFTDYIPNTSCVDSFCQNVTISANIPCNLTAGWTYSNHSGDTVHFYGADTSTTAHRYWTFGDGSAAGTGTDPVHVYSTPGTYHVCLHIYTGSNCMDSFCSTISVGTPCRITAAWTETTNGDTVHFAGADTSTAAHHYWNFGDGTTGSGLDATHVYANPGTYHVCLYVYLPYTTCSDSFCSNVTIGSGCHVSAVWSYTTRKDTASFVSADTSTAAHHYWSFGDGSGGSGINLTHIYAHAGTYHVCLYVYIPNTNCADSSCNTITITSSCTANAAWQSYSIGDSVHFYAANTDTTVHLDWNFGDGTYGFGRFPWHTYTQAGTYHVCLYAYTGSNCVDSFCNNVTVGSGCNITAAWTYTAHGDSVSFTGSGTNTTAHYYWNFGDGTTVSGYSASHVYAQPGTYHVCHYVYIPNTNCYDSSCNTIIVTNGCTLNAAWQSYTNGDTVHFYSADTSSIVHHIWNFGDGNYTSGINVTHVYPNYGTYHVCLIEYIPNTSCSDSFCHSVTVGSTCHVSAAWSYTTHGDTVNFVSADTNSAAHHYWNFGDGTTVAGISPSHIYLQAGTYHVCQYAYIPNTNCTDSSCNTITIAGSCLTNAAWTSYNRGDSVHFYAYDTSTVVHLIWNFGDGNGGSGKYLTHVYTAPGTYHVCLYAYIPNTNCSDSFCNTVTVGGGCSVTAAWTYAAYGDSLHFVSADTNTAAHHIWNYGDGTYGTGFNASHLYATPGTYHVCSFVYIPNTNCTDSSCNTIVVTRGCVTNAAWQSYTHGDTVQFYAADTNTTVHLDWNFGDGSYGFGLNPSHTYTQAGTYHVCLYAYIPNTHCLDSFCNTVTIGAGCTISATWSYTLHGDTVSFTAADTNTAAHHYWNLGDGTSASGMTLTHVYAHAGSYHVCLYAYVPNTTCFDSSCNSITIVDSCIANAAWRSYTHGDTVQFYAADTNSALHLDWNFGDGSYSYGTHPSHVYAQAGTYHICLYAYTGTNCIDSFCNTVTIGSGCNISATWTYTAYGDSAHFTGSGTNTTAHYYWNFGDGTVVSGYDASHIYTAPGTYHVCHYVYIPNTNCVDSSCNTITIAGPCNLTAVWNYINASHDTVHFYAAVPDSSATLVWIYGDGTSSTGSYTVHGYPAPGNYHVTLYVYISGTSCFDSVSLDINIGNSCAVTAAWESLTRINDSIQFYALDPDTNAHHIWTFGDGTSASGTYAAHTFPTAGTYHVCLYVYIPNTTCSDSLCKDVSSALGIDNISAYYPTISLSPNPFSQSAIMNIDGPASVYEVRIYDMLGQLIRTDRANNNSILIQRGSMSSGIYTYAVVAGGAVIGKGKMSVE